MNHATATMDARTLKALELSKVLDILAECCVSDAGRAASLALRPLSSFEAIRTEQNVFEQNRTWLARPRRDTQDDFSLVNFPDCTGLLEHMEKPTFVVDGDGLWALREVLILAKKAVESIRKNEIAWPELAAEASSQALPELFIAALIRCLGDDGLLRDESSPELLLVRGELRRLHQNCLRHVKDFAVQYNIAHYLQDDYMTLASDRYVLPLKSNFKGRVQGIIHDYSNTGETCYFEPMFLVEQNNRLQELKQEEREEERKIFAMLSNMARSELPLVQAAWRFVVRLDVLQAKSRLAERFNGHCVSVTPPNMQSGLELLAARHPLLALDVDLARQGGPSPLDLRLSADDNVLVISGGNAGGKTVCLKTLGLITAMTLAGLPVPVGKGSRLPWWPTVHAFIGDEQSLDDHVSTFTAQICSLAGMWPQATKGTLVLLDEFGAGTDPSQGAALAQAVLDGLMERGACVIAATHFPALKTYALSRTGVRAASVLFDPQTKRPLFRLAYDQVGASLALDVAREHGLPESVLKQAEHYLLLDGEDMTVIMDRLNALAAEREKSLDQLNLELAEARKKRDHYKERFERERERLAVEVRGMASELMTAWKAGKTTAKQTLKELSKVRATLVKVADHAKEDSSESTPDLQTLKVGQSVTHKPWNKKAIVAEVNIRQQRVKLDMNGVSLWVEPQLIALRTQAAVSTQSGARHTLNRSPNTENQSLLRIDVRGKSGDVALHELERFLDRALLGGMEGVEIVHGRGTGALRRQIHTFLQAFPGIGSYAVATEEQGGDGVTLVTFK